MTITAADFPNPIFCALDTADLQTAKLLARDVGPAVGGLKLGKEFFMANGPEGVADVMRAAGQSVFLDLKLHDIPNTVAQAVRAVAPLSPAILNVHACGGLDMMRAAAEACAEEADKLGKRKPALIGVTVLTSMDETGLSQVGVAGGVNEQVLRLALLAKEAGLDGVVCSARENRPLREVLGPAFLLVTPGIRPTWAMANDQKRIVTPKQAMADGSDILVVGRPITAALNPGLAARQVAEEVGVNGLTA